jgi:hypothetical protein
MTVLFAAGSPANSMLPPNLTDLSVAQGPAAASCELLSATHPSAALAAIEPTGRGIEAKPSDDVRTKWAREGDDTLRKLMLDATTPGFAEFDLTAFLTAHQVAAPAIFDSLDAIVHEAGLRGIRNRLVSEGQELVLRYPSHKLAAAAAVIAPTAKNGEAFQLAIVRAEEFLRAGQTASATTELQKAKLCAPNADCLAKAEQVLAMLAEAPTQCTTPNQPEAAQLSPMPAENLFTEEEAANIQAIIEAHKEDPDNPELLEQLHALKNGLIDFLQNTEAERIGAFFGGDLGRIYQEIVALQLGSDPTAPAKDDLTTVIKAGFTQIRGGFDPRPLLCQLLSTPKASRIQKSNVYQ